MNIDIVGYQVWVMLGCYGMGKRCIVVIYFVGKVWLSYFVFLVCVMLGVFGKCQQLWEEYVFYVVRCVGYFGLKLRLYVCNGEVV